ncbi:MAG: hypothetical protein JO335_11850 [Sphingomonas sp.]|nr:hypothetical protein [Sphingomonas sp.]
MTALAGWVGDGATQELERHSRVILDGQSAYFNVEASTTSVTGAAFAGGSSKPSVGQSPIAGSARYLVAADARIDNRDELAAQLGPLAGFNADQLPDSVLVLQGWSKWQTGLLDRLVGDFAIAIFDSTDRRLFVARDPSGQRPLFFAHHGERLAFASMPSGLLAHRELRMGWNPRGFQAAFREELARPETYFRGVMRLLPGHCLSFAGGQLDIRRWWQPNLTPLAMSDADFVDGYREVLDRAVECRLASPSPLVGCYLSSGWDSNAVAATAGRSQAVKVAAFTSAPAKTFLGPIPKGYCADESLIAASAAALYGAQHKVIRQSPVTLEFLQAQASAYQEPARNILNAAWGAEIHRAAASRGIDVLLTGALGNLTLNYGGLPVLAGWLAAGQFGEWSSQAFHAWIHGSARLRGVVFNSVAPWLPARVWRVARPQGHSTAWFLHPDLRHATTSAMHYQPSASAGLDRIRMITLLDHGMITKGAIAEAKVDERDPFSDRRLLEFSLRLPPSQLLNKGISRPLARRALSDRVAPEVLNASLKGLQSADWQNRLNRDEVLRTLDAISGDDHVAGILDLRRIRTVVDRWPVTDREALHHWGVYTGSLPIALATGVFIKHYSALVS